MDGSEFAYVIVIRSTPEQVWDALVDPEMTRRYWGAHRNVSDWKVGSAWEHQDYGDASTVDIVGRVMESDRPRRLVLSWADPSRALDPAMHSRVTFEVEPFIQSVRLTVTHEHLDPEMLRGVTAGWPVVLSSLKTLLETGEPLPTTDRRWHGPPE